jgi:hypothetical protein
MRFRRPLAACAVLLCMVGCESNKSAQRDPDLQPKGVISDAHRPINEALVRGYQLEQADNAIITQHTLYPYHFVAHSVELNDLGNREVHVLAKHYRNNPGPVNLNRSDESDGLYEGRIKTVLDTMAKYGVESGRITVKEGLPGGDGLSSNQVVLVVERMRKADNSRSGSGSSSKSNSDSGSGSSERANTRTIETSGGY